MRLMKLDGIRVSAFCFVLSAAALAQTPPSATDQKTDQNQTPASPEATAPAAPAAPAALPTPAITGPLSGLPPAVFDAGPFGKIAANGILRLGHVAGQPRPG